MPKVVNSEMLVIKCKKCGYGVSIDKHYVSNALVKIERRTEEVANKIYEMVGDEFNINSTQQVGEILNSLGIYSPPSESSKSYLLHSPLTNSKVENLQIIGSEKSDNTILIKRIDLKS